MAQTRARSSLPLLVTDHTFKPNFLTFTLKKTAVESLPEAGITNEQDLVMAITVQWKSQKKTVLEAEKSNLHSDLCAMCLALRKSPWKQRNNHLMEKETFSPYTF